MEFNSLFFLFVYLPIFIGLMAVIKDERIRNILLLVFSVFFYISGDIKHFLILCILILLTYLFGRHVKGNGKIYFLYLVCVLGTLCFFKYGNTLAEAIDLYTKHPDLMKIVMPLGISFYTFTSISYISDVYYEKYEYEKDILDLASFLTFFPVVISGPLIRYDSFKNFLNEKKIDNTSVSSGLRRFLIGLGKKVIIANQLSIICDTLFTDSTQASFLLAGYALSAYALQLYYDFSGYSDMAIGIGQMIGYTIPENFETPYFSHSIAEFWRRWHITLGVWFKEYLYYPLLRTKWMGRFVKSLSKKIPKKQARVWSTVLALFITWFLIGCWHGSTWRFLLYGLYHGFFIICDTLLSKAYASLREKCHIKSDSKLWKAFQIIRTDVIVTLGYILFRCETLRQIKIIVKALIGRGFRFDGWYVRQLDILYLLPYFFVGLLFLFPFVHRFFKKVEEKAPYIYDLLLVLIAAVSVFFIVSGSYSAFIYFNF